VRVVQDFFLTEKFLKYAFVTAKNCSGITISEQHVHGAKPLAKLLKAIGNQAKGLVRHAG
jgi:hypothetical protein